ncbi:Sterile alpha motif type 2 [Penicillium cf. griseofulvum]|uniref:Sterile alpha motif type 2 n=1 Tax=Penicillium cf. griseofulvum TaxID=2972120 RepID=A0A9W9IUJ2_9EURO|nr:Sterile alpha motif type 2 [Penicillium cf. griseofulvum]KAJ5430100.1 Sterile alpha motif type 2 [Penicillium cf. griseofulvum]
MEAQYAYDMRYIMNRKEEPLPLFPPKTAIYRPYSEATEIFEENGYRGYSDNSPMRSVASFGTGTGSISTASTPDNIATPDSTGLTAFDFHIDENDIRGPSGPHLFWSSPDSDQNSVIDMDPMVEQTPIATTGPYHHRASRFDPFRRDTPVPNHSNPTPETHHFQQPTPFARQTLQSSRMTMPHDWTPSEVVEWMQSLGLENDIVDTFFANDISGSILLELQNEDLKELEIASFGKRRKVMGYIKNLRGSSMFTDTDASSRTDNASLRTDTASSRTETASSHTYTTSLRSRNSSITSDVSSTRNTSVMSGTTHTSCYATDEESNDVNPWARHQNYDTDIYKRTDLIPDDSVSIVAIEQVLPKPHKCKKGEDCHKWQKQQAMISRLADDLPFEHFGSRRIVAGDPGNPKTAPNLLKSPKSEFTQSLTASSDIMGPGELSAFQLSQDRLRELKPRDPQENVRNFLNFQSLNRLQTDNQPVTPPREIVPFSQSESCDSAKITPTLSEHLRHLPRLRIPSMHDSSDESVFTESIFTTENSSPLRTVTPSILSRRNQFNYRTAVPGRQECVASEVAPSPADYYRVDPYYRSETPLSDVDAPMTAVPIGPVSREDSQSVPPNMRFGNSRYVTEESTTRPFSTRAESHWRRPSIQDVTALNPLKENYAMSPIETPEDLQRTPRVPQLRNNTLFPSTRREVGDVTHSGWMKKRKNTKLLRHDWENHHFTLKGTQLSMHDDIALAHRNSKALEHIDVDDYAVACSSNASKSKLTAAFKRTVLKRNDNAQDVSAFAFSLVPTPNGNGFVDRKTMFLNSGKSHHFAVNTRDERIDWMRELMLAKALKRGQDSGAELTFNKDNVI